MSLSAYPNFGPTHVQAVGNAAHIESRTLHTCAATYLASRIAYNLAYILIEDRE
jgi:uncharacterized MAPEG superfamily protein